MNDRESRALLILSGLIAVAVGLIYAAASLLTLIDFRQH